MIHCRLVIKTSELIFEPPFQDLEAIVNRLITTIVESGRGLSRVEHVLFPDLQGCELVIPCVELGEGVVREARGRALESLQGNFIGPQKLALSVYLFNMEGPGVNSVP